MNERHYANTLRNCAPRMPPQLLAGGLGRQIVQRAAAILRRQSAAQRCWEAVCERNWQRCTRVCEFSRGTLVIEACEATVAARIQSQAARLVSLLAERLPGVQRLRVVASARLPADRDFDAGA